MNPYYTSKPPKTAKISRDIWDMLTKYIGQEPHALWRNWNGMCWGAQLSDADYGAWKYDDVDVPDFIMLLAGIQIGKMSYKDWYAKNNPKALVKIREDAFKFCRGELHESD